MSGAVELGVIVANMPIDRIGAIALPDPLISGPTLASTFLSPTSLRALVAAWAGSYWPAVAVALFNTMGSSVMPLSSPLALASLIASNAPFRIRCAASASAPVSGRVMPIR